MSGTRERSWSPGPVIPVGITAGIVLAGAGLVLMRPDLSLLGIPLVLAAVLAWSSRPARDIRNELSIGMSSQPERGSLSYELGLRREPGAEAVHLRLTTLGDRRQEVIVTAEQAERLRGRVPVIHSGPQTVLAVDARLLSSDGAFATAPLDTVGARAVIVPTVRPLNALPLPPRLQGLTGGHDSRRPGDGGDFHDVSLFHPGDRLRRIDWKATVRRSVRPGELYVRRNVASAEAVVILVVDSRDEIAENVASWSRNVPSATGVTSMDLARAAASTLAAAYIRAGDRVGFQDLATSGRAVPPGGGGRQLERLVQTIARTHPTGRPQRRRRAPAVTSGALLVVFSTFLDDEAGRMAAMWRAAGHRVVAVDVFPVARLDRLSSVQIAAYRIVTMERVDRVAALRARGVEVVTWQDAADRLPAAAQLRALTRAGRRR